MVQLVGRGCLQLVRWKVSFTVVEKCSKVDRRCYLPLCTNDSTGGHQRSRNVSVVTVFKPNRPYKPVRTHVRSYKNYTSPFLMYVCKFCGCGTSARSVRIVCGFPSGCLQLPEPAHRGTRQKMFSVSCTVCGQQYVSLDCREIIASTLLLH